MISTRSLPKPVCESTEFTAANVWCGRLNVGMTTLINPDPPRVSQALSELADCCRLRKRNWSRSSIQLLKMRCQERHDEINLRKQCPILPCPHLQQLVQVTGGLIEFGLDVQQWGGDVALV